MKTSRCSAVGRVRTSNGLGDNPVLGDRLAEQGALCTSFAVSRPRPCFLGEAVVEVLPFHVLSFAVESRLRQAVRTTYKPSSAASAAMDSGFRR